tara:strand:- start:2058 stop:3485 length:1428 start_codon:yes stop_codon:yes gene_type:complete
MFLDFNSKKNITETKNHLLKNNYDFIIIGTGPAGVALYRSILKIKNKKLLIIEKGDIEKNKFEKIIAKNLPIKLDSRVFSVGGTSNKWSNISSYFEEFEMCQGFGKYKKNLWPLTHRELIKWYNKIDSSYGFNFKKIKDTKQKENIPFTFRKFLAKIKPTNFRKFINSKQIDIIYNCEVSSVDEIKNQSCVFIKEKNTEIKLYTKKIILCAGGVASTQIILNSLHNKRLKNMKNNKFVGLNFMEHPKFTIGYLKYPKDDLIKKLEVKYIKKEISYIGISLPKNYQNSNHLSNSYIRFEKTNIDFEVNKYKINFYHLLKLLVKILFPQKKNKQFFWKIRMYCEMSPSIKNRILLSRQDKKIIINYKIYQSDLRTIKNLSKKIYNFFSAKPFLEKKIILSNENIKKNLQDSSHHMGGLCYSVNPKKTVIDKNLRIMGTKNIYACTSAIFPTSGSVNPTMTIIALAQRLAMHLTKKKL